MKNIFSLFLVFLCYEIAAQNKRTIFYDSLGKKTTYENHGSQVFTGRYKSIYNKKENTKRLTRTTEQEFKANLIKTEKRISTKYRLGTNFPDFKVKDIAGNTWSKAELTGKVLVINFWFIGCAPCEAERPLLNDLTKLYADNKRVVFLSLAKNNSAQLTEFLKEYPLLYNVVPTDKDYIKDTFGVNAYPVNIIIDKNGKYSFNSSATGIGIVNILQRQIDKALN